MSDDVPRETSTAVLTEEQSRELLFHARYTPVRNWPGSPNKPWHVRCELCVAEVYVRPSNIRRDQLARGVSIRTRCTHPTSNIIVPSAAMQQRAGDVPRETSARHQEESR